MLGRGLILVERNCKTPFGEVDLILKNARGRHFLIEVKSTSNFDYLEQRIKPAQIRRYQRILSWYPHENTQILFAYISAEKILILEHEANSF